jgi:formylglycine-generating enzyme required for sulfatase activity
MIIFRKLLRGGSWGYYPADCRSHSRTPGHPKITIPQAGFRVCRLSVKQ